MTASALHDETRIGATLDVVPVRDIQVDETYYRQLHRSAIERWHRGGVWSDEAAGAIDVNYRPDGSGPWLIDGRHRLTSMIETGRTTALAFVHHVPREQEIEIYERRNVDRTRVDAIDRLWAAVERGDEATTALMDTLQTYGYAVPRVPPRGQTRGNMVVCAAAMLELARAGHLDAILAVTSAAWSGEQAAVQSPMLRALGNTLRVNPDLDRDHLIDRLARTTPDILIKRAQIESRTSGQRAVTVLYRLIAQRYNEERRGKQRIPIRIPTPPNQREIPREKVEQAVDLLARGSGIQAIAQELGISQQTVRAIWRGEHTSQVRTSRA